MQKKDKDKLKTLLLERKENLEKEIGRLVSDVRESAGSEHMDWVDAASDATDQNSAMAVAQEEAKELGAINDALHRMDEDPKFGTCAVTGKEISLRRLEVLPFTRLSADGARQLEKEGRAGEIL